MGASELLIDLQSQGLHLEADGERLRVTPASKLTDKLRAEIRHHKHELLQALVPDAGAYASATTPYTELCGDPDLSTVLTEGYSKLNLDPTEIQAELVGAGDWPHMTSDRLRVYIEAVARTRRSGSVAALEAVIEQWTEVAGLPAHQRRQLLTLAHATAPAFLRDEINYFRRRIQQAKRW